jgi:UDP-2-acetamido-3-amino-2,3-dideoxy-glucuronate N-acetyltransferase
MRSFASLRMTRKNIVVVGSGYWGKNLVRNFHELGALLGVCDIDDKTLRSFKAQYPDIRTYSDIRAVFRDREVKAAAVATPATTHFAVVKEALLAGKDVFVEKPIALRLKEGEELVSLAKTNGRVLMVGHILEYHPAVAKLKEMIDAGELGKIRYIYSNRLNLGKIRTEENILWSFAPHDISIILLLLGEMPTEVVARGGTYISPDVADVTVTNLAFPSGAKAHIFVSWLHPYKEQKLVVIGEKKMVLFDDVSSVNKLLGYDHRIDWVDGLPVPRPDQAQPIEFEKREPLKSECQHFIDCVASRVTPQTDGAKGLNVLKVLEACEESLQGRII